MRIKVVGFILTVMFGVVVAYVIGMAFNFYLDPGVVIDPATWAMRFVTSPDNVYAMIQTLSNMLWHYRGLDMVLLGVFLLAAALASSAFFYEITKKPTETEEKE
ncbi:MAG: hypothetical protein ACFFBR_00800 [Promethearchaeota archaeon]